MHGKNIGIVNQSLWLRNTESLLMHESFSFGNVYIILNIYIYIIYNIICRIYMYIFIIVVAYVLYICILYHIAYNNIMQQLPQWQLFKLLAIRMVETWPGLWYLFN